MAIAWGSLVLLVLLLPGVLFFVGIYWPEKFTREAEQRSPLGHLAAVLLLAFFIHGTSYALLSGWCGETWPCISVEALLQILHPDQRQFPATSAMLREFRWWIMLYMLWASFVGFAAGGLYGYGVATGRFRRLTRHPWVYELGTDGLTYAYVLTNIQHEDRILMYKGFLVSFGLQQDGRFSYIILRDITRYYMILGEPGPVTSALAHQKVIGSNSADTITDPTGVKQMKKVQSHFIIEGEDVANVVFDQLAIDAKPMSMSEFRQFVRDLEKEIDLALDEQRAEAVGAATALGLPSESLYHRGIRRIATKIMEWLARDTQGPGNPNP